MNIFKGISTSAAFKLDRIDIQKTIRDLLIVAASAALVAVGNYVEGLDLGVYAVVIVPIVSGLISGAMRWLRNNDSDPNNDSEEKKNEDKLVTKGL